MMMRMAEAYLEYCQEHCTKMKFSSKDFFSKYDQIRRNVQNVQKCALCCLSICEAVGSEREELKRQPAPFLAFL